MENISVGQVVFVFVKEEILPVQIVEEVVHRKLAGVETRYFVRASPEDGAKIVQLDMNKTRVFLNLADARKFMIDNATKAIDEICAEANNSYKRFHATKEANDSPFEESTSNEQLLEPQAQIEGTKRVRLPNGEFVNVVL